MKRFKVFLKQIDEVIMYMSYIIAFCWFKLFGKDELNPYYQKGGCYQGCGWAPFFGWHYGPFIGITSFIFRKDKKEDKYKLLSFDENKTARNLWSEHTIGLRYDFWSQFGWDCMWYDGPIMTLHLGFITAIFVYPQSDFMYKIYKKHEQTAPWDIKNLFKKK